MELPFAKMHGLGNDFVVLDVPHPWLQLAPHRLLEHLSALARLVCPRHTGVGADGVIAITPSTVAAYRMLVINADGSSPEMCGNGLRCAAGFVAERFADQAEVLVETGAGVLCTALELRDTGTGAGRVRVNMGTPRLCREHIPMLGAPAETALEVDLHVGEHAYVASALSMGNPHCVLFLDAQGGTPLAGSPLESSPLELVGPQIEHLEVFPAGTNVELAELVGPDEIAVRVWERGVGLTLACGTGACAVMVAAAGRDDAPLETSYTVEVPGGTVVVTRRADEHIELRGPAQLVARATISSAL